MTSTNHVPSDANALKLDIQVAIDEEDNSVYVKFLGFENLEDAEKYADHLAEYLPLMLFESKIEH